MGRFLSSIYIDSKVRISVEFLLHWLKSSPPDLIPLCSGEFAVVLMGA